MEETKLGNVQKGIMWTAIVLMIIFIGVCIWSFIQAGKSEPWPPIPQPCPDYWTVTSTGCKASVNNMGSCTASSVLSFANINDCDKYKWATGDTGTGLTSCGKIEWDGITYGYGQYSACDE